MWETGENSKCTDGNQTLDVQFTVILLKFHVTDILFSTPMTSTKATPFS